MAASTWTVVVMLIAAVLLIGWDVYVAFFNKEKKDTISEIMMSTARAKGVWGLPFAFGVLGGHLFLPSSRPLLEQPLAAMVLIITAVVLTVSGMVYRRFWKYNPSWPAVMAFILLGGIAAGFFLWPQGG